MLSPVVIGVLVAVAGLILLYLVARKFKRFGHAAAFACAVAGRLLVTLSYHMERAASYFKKVLDAALKSINDTDEWTMRVLLWLLIWFCIGLLILAGESIQVLEVLPSLFQGATVSLPPFFELSSAALFICCSALFGDIVLECWGKVRGVGLFHNMGKPSRWIVGSLSMLLLIFSDLVNGFFYIYRAEILARQPTSGMTVYILGGLGLEVSAVAPFALLAVKEGSPAMVAVFMWIAEKTFQILHAAATFIPDLLDTLALYLSGGTIGVYGKQIERDPHKYPVLFGNTHPSQPGALALAASSGDATSDTEEIVPVETTQLQEVKIMKPDNVSIVFVGPFGSRIRLFVVQIIEQLRAKDSFLTSGHLDLTINHVQTALPDIVDISLPPGERFASSLHGKNEGETYQTALNRIGDRLVETHLPYRATPSALIFVIEAKLLPNVIDMFESVKRRLPLHSLVAVTSVSDLDLANSTVQTGIRDLISLHSEDIVETVIVTSPRSPFAASFGEETELKCTAQALVSLVLSHRHNLSNRSFTTILQELHSLSPICTLSFASAPVALGSVRKRFKWIPGVSAAPGSHSGDFSDILLQGRSVATRALNDSEARAFDAEVSAEYPCVVVYNTPLPLSDPRFNEFSRDMALWTTSNYPFTSSITVRGNGIALPPHLGGKFLVQATAIYPFQPSSYPRLQPAKTVKVTPLYPVNTAIEPAVNNGKVAPPVANKAGANKPASSSRRSKTPARRVVVRKNAKQEK